VKPTTPSYANRFRWDAHLWGIVAIAVLAAALRLYHLGSVPTELVADEVDLYNSAHSIVTTGHDVDGSLEPFLASMFTRNPPMYAVFSYGSSLVFGKSAFALRLPAALMGVAAVILIYLIALELTRRRDVALVAALIQATQPIFVHFSRIAWEPSSELPFLLGGLYLLLRALRPTSGARWLFGAAVTFGLACYTYLAAWFYTVVLAGALVLAGHERFRTTSDRVRLIVALVLWIAIAIPAFSMIFGDSMTVGRTQRMETFANGVSWQSLGVFVHNYLAQFRWSYLVTTGDPQPGTSWRYLVEFGAFYWWVVPLALIGAFASARYIATRWGRLWLYVWLVAYPLGGALTTDGVPNAPRTLAGAPVFCILAAIGFVQLRDALAHLRTQRARALAVPALYALFSVCVATSTLLFSVGYFTRYVHVYPNAWDSGTRATFSYIITHEARYDRVCISIYPAWYNLETYVRFYLSGTRVPVIEDTTDIRCDLPGTLMVNDDDHTTLRPGFVRLTMIRDLDRNPFTVISARPKTTRRTSASTSSPTARRAPSTR
jgi:4-amino-4-deoxy-L-arabinose transferase-like glycosyltransferase